MRYIKQIVNRNKKLVFVYLIIGLFNAFMVNFKADYFQKVIDALAEHTLSPYRVFIYGSVLFISYLMNYVDEYPAKKLEHGIFLDFKLMALEKISRIRYQEYQKLGTGKLVQRIENGADIRQNLIRIGADGHMRQKLLVVDDEKGIVDMMAGYFATQYDVLTAYSGQEALQKVTACPDLILLDINMPGLDGLAVCRKIREYVTCPILFLTARVESADKIDGFRAGADDYIVKPFDLDELAARIDAHLRREQRRQNHMSVRFFGELAVDYTARTVAVNGECVPLSRREFDIVELLSLHAGQVFDRERIYEIIWGIDGDGSSDTIMEHIRKIRAKLAVHTNDSYIDTVWGCGYKWNG